MNVDNYGWESSLSMIANEQTRTAIPRHGHGEVPILLRPVFMNAVEVGYSYAHCDRDKKLNVRGVTIALWHFICRGHQAIALLPYCFKNYAEKSTRYSELMMLYRLNLIEFTPGYGTEKYTEVNRIMVGRAYETGGCLVARSQMQGITDNKAHFVDLVENRLLMPTFNGDDIMFPIDGPLGRNGPSLQQTLQCERGSGDWRVCSEHQLLLSDQRHWLEKLALLVPEKVIWTRMTQVVQSGGTEDVVDDENEPPMIPSPPLENPFQRSSSSSEQHHHHQHQASPSDLSVNIDSFPPHYQEPSHHIQNPNHFHHRRPPSRRFGGPQHYHMGGQAGPGQHSQHYHHPNSGRPTRHIIRYGTSPPRAPGRHGGRQRIQRMDHLKHSDTTESVGSMDSTQSGEFESIEMDEDVARELNARLMEETREESIRKEKADAEQKKKDETLAQLSQIFGYSKSIRVMTKFPKVTIFNVLVEKCIHEPDEDGDHREFADIWASSSGESSSNNDDDVVEDLIDFSDSPLIPTGGQQSENQGTEQLVDLMS